MIKVEKIDTVASMEALEGAWDELNRASCEESINFSYNWFASWWKIFGGKRKLHILYIHEDGNPIGIAPLMSVDIKVLGKPFRILGFIGYPDAEQYGFIGPDKKLIAREIFVYLFKNRGEWSRLDCSRLTRDLSLEMAIREILRQCNGYYWAKTRKIVAFGDYPAPPPDSGELLEPAIEMAKRDLAPTSELIIDSLTDIGGIESNMPVFFQLQLNNHRENPESCRFSETSYRRFYYELVKRFSAKGKANLVRLFAGDIPVAYGLNFSSGNKVEMHDVAVNPLFTRRIAEKLFMLMEAGMFSGQGRSITFSRKLPVAGSFPPREIITVRDLSVFSRRAVGFWSALSSIFMDNWLLERARRSEKYRQFREKSSLILHKEGLKTLLLKATSKIFHLVGGLAATYYVYRYDGGTPRMTHLKIEIEIRKFGLADLDRVATFYGVNSGSMKLETFKERFCNNADCYVALHHGFIVAMVWGLYHEDRYRQHGVSLRPERDEVVISDALTSAIYRSMGIAPYLLGTMLNDYAERGLKAVAGVHKNNIPSRRGLEAYNFKHVRTDRVLKILGIRII